MTLWWSAGDMQHRGWVLALAFFQNVSSAVLNPTCYNWSVRPLAERAVQPNTGEYLTIAQSLPITD